MPVTTVDSKAALIVIDLQKGLMDFPFAHPIKEVVARTQKLIDAFRRAGQTVGLVNCSSMPHGRTEAPRPDFTFPDHWVELIPELRAQSSDIIVTKPSWGAFSETTLGHSLKSAGITQVVLAGIVTSMGVESTAREAFSMGFNVALAVDAMTDLNADTHSNSVTRIFPNLGETAEVASIVALLDDRCS